MSNISKYYDLSTEVKSGFNGKMHEMSPAQQLKAKQVLEAFEAAEKTFYEFRNEISKLNDAVAWINTLSQKSENSYADYWRTRFNKLKVYANGGELNSEIIEMLK